MNHFALGFIVSVLFRTALEAHGHDHAPGEICPSALKALAGRFVILGSGGRDSDVFNQNRDNLFRIREVAARLGYHTSPMTVRHMDASEMASVTANGRLPVPHALEGAAILENARRAAGILEMVTPGEVRHEQLVRDTNSVTDTALVYAHVEGHNDFFRYSNLYRVRKMELYEDSEILASTVSRAYWQYDKAEVARFYQLIQSLRFLQDVHRGSFEDPAQFQNKVLDQRPEITVDTKTGMTTARERRGNHPTQPTQSIMQALVENLPPSAPDWQRQILRQFERVSRFTGAAIITKNMNEGWATIAEEILLPYVFEQHSDHFDFGQLNSGVAFPKIDNPYWIGREAWRRIREKFQAAPEIKGLKPDEQDARFVDYAHQLIATMSDYDFLMFGLDEAWVQQHNLMLYREHDNPDQNIAITRDASRIARYLASRIANMEDRIPSIWLKSFNDRGRGRMMLEHRDIKAMPLSQPAMVKTLYVLSQIMNQPVGIETFASHLWNREAPSMDRVPMTVTVSPRGDIEVEFLKGAPSFRSAEQHKAMLTKYLEAYQRDIQISYSKDRSVMRGEKPVSFAAESPVAHSNVVNYMVSAPYASEAVTEYFEMVSRRTAAQMEAILSGKRRAEFSGDHQFLEINAVPEVPMFLYDGMAKRVRSMMTPKTHPDGRSENLPVDLGSDDFALALNRKAETHPDFAPDEDIDLGSGPYQPGDVWDKPKPREGEGEGQGEASDQLKPGDSQEDGVPGRNSEDGESKEGQNGQGSGGKQRIPIEDFGERLAERLELRDLRRTGRGDLYDVEEIRTGSAQRPNGYLRDDRTAENDYAKGWALAKAQGKNPRKMKFQELLKLGSLHRGPEDLVVADRENEPMPLTNAVIVFVRDGSGSMGQSEIKLVDQFSAHIEAVMKHFYKKVKIRYVMYSNDAEEVNRTDFYTRHKDGGTDLSTGLTLTQEIMTKDFPRHAWNRYVFVFSDGGDFNPEGANQLVKAMVEEVEQLGYSHIDPHGMGVVQHSQEMQAAAKSDNHKGRLAFAHLTPVYQSVLDGLREFFKPRQKVEPR